MSTHRDPTASQALGNVDRELRQMAALALKLRTSPGWTGTPEDRYRRAFTGIYRKLLTCPLEELESLAPRRR